MKAELTNCKFSVEINEKEFNALLFNFDTYDSTEYCSGTFYSDRIYNKISLLNTEKMIDEITSQLILLLSDALRKNIGCYYKTSRIDFQDIGYSHIVIPNLFLKIYYEDILEIAYNVEDIDDGEYSKIKTVIKNYFDTQKKDGKVIKIDTEKIDFTVNDADSKNSIDNKYIDFSSKKEIINIINSNFPVWLYIDERYSPRLNLTDFEKVEAQ